MPCSGQSNEGVSSQQQSEPTILPPPPAIRTHSMQLRQNPRRNHKYPFSQALLAERGTAIEPTCFTQASKDVKWRNAMAEEYNALLQNQTWELIPPSPRLWKIVQVRTQAASAVS